MHHERLRLTTRIPAAAAGIALVDYLAARFRYHDRAGWQAKIAAGAIRVDDAPASPWTRLRRGMAITYDADHREPDVVTEVPILVDTPTLLVVDKPAGLPVHADGVFIRNTLVNVLRQQHGAELQPAHRLDRETSGVLVLGKNKAASNALQAQFQRGEVAKTYVAVVRGVVAQDAFAIEAPIGRDPHSRVTIRRAVVAKDAAGAQPARTEVRVLARGRTRTLVEVVPKSGRTHQIRVHLAALGYSVAGDVLYGRDDDSYLAWIAHVKAGGDPAWPEGRDAPRHLLHALRLRVPPHLPVPVPLPAIGLVFEAPFPADLQRALVDDGAPLP